MQGDIVKRGPADFLELTSSDKLIQAGLVSAPTLSCALAITCASCQMQTYQTAFSYQQIRLGCMCPTCHSASAVEPLTMPTPANKDMV